MSTKIIDWKENARHYFWQCYENEFDQEYEFSEGKSLCQLIGYALYGEPDETIEDNKEDKFGYSEKKANHIFKIQKVIYKKK